MKLFKYLYKICGSKIIVITIVSIMSGIINTALLALINKGIFEENQSPLLLLAVFFALCVTMLASRVIAQISLIKLSQGITAELQMEVSKKTISAPLQKIESIGAARIMSVVTGDINLITNTLLVVPLLIMQLAIIIGSMFYLAYLSTSLFAVLLIAIVFGVVLNIKVTKSAKSNMSSAREQQDLLFKNLRELTDGVKELKLNQHRSNYFINTILFNIVDKIRINRITGRNRYVVAQTWGQGIIYMFLGLLVFAWPLLYANSGASVSAVDAIQNNTAAIVGSYITVILFSIGPLTNLLSKIPTLSQADISLNKIEELVEELSVYPLQDNLIANTPPVQTWHSLRIRNMQYQHKASNGKGFALGPVNLEFRPGEIIFFVGPNGSGKSTLAKLLVGLYEPGSGKIELDGETIDEKNRHWYRQHFSSVFSDYHLFEQLMGIENLEEREAEIESFLTMFNLKDSVQVDGQAFSTTMLSSGQRRRLAMLSAYLEDRPFYLFDEWAADQDPEFRALFYRDVLSQLKKRGKTIFVISHDNAYFDIADRTFNINQGELEPSKKMCSN